jgi:hypothetical protein
LYQLKNTTKSTLQF